MYLRLSMEDEDKEVESNSIRNQRKQIYEYIHHDSELGRLEVAEFCDDGYSGTNMERPGMQKMLKEVKNNKIKCIIVKDMSRFSRDYIEMGTYLNHIFPFMGIRFIAINDHYDSSKQPKNSVELGTAFQTLLYDLYSKDVSVKVKASIENKCANGEYVFGQVPFGYEKSKDIKNAIVVNEQEAVIVRYIFSLAIQGKGSTQIARQLYEEHVPTITKMRKPDKEYTDGKVHSWTENAVRRILNNRFYIGEMAYGKSVRKAVGSKKCIAISKEEWKIIKNHHEALISEEVYEQAALFKPGVSTKRKRKKHPLTGKLYCAGCGYSLNYKPFTEKNRYRRFECRKHALLQIPECCSSINAHRLEEAILLMLNQELQLLVDAVKKKQSFTLFQKKAKAQLKEEQLHIRKLEARKDSLYEQYALGKIAKEMYQAEANVLAEKITQSLVNVKKTTSGLEKLEREYQENEEAKNQINAGVQIQKLTQEVTDTFIKRVFVHKNKRLEIEWNFVWFS